jgi:hypothetical protein
MTNLSIGFVIVTMILFSISAVALLWSAIDYSQAYEVEATRCQYVKHSTIVGFRGGLNGYVAICWEVPELEPNRVDGPVTMCRGEHVVTGISCDAIMAELKEKYPISHPPNMFPCYKATSNYLKMFLTKPDTEAWKDKFSVGILFLLSGVLAVCLWFFCHPTPKPKKD